MASEAPTRGKGSGWEFDDQKPPSIPHESLDFLSSYTGIEDRNLLEGRVRELLEECRSKLHVYCCVAQLRFLQPSIQKQEWWELVLSAIKDSAAPLRILECGTCFGQDLRYLLKQIDSLPADVPRPVIDVTDYESGYFELGRRLFGDETTLVGENQKVKEAFFCDITPDSVPELEGRYGTYDIVISMAMVHVFSKPQTRGFLRNIQKLLKPNGGIFVGYGGGLTREGTSGPWERADTGGSGRYLFNPIDLETEMSEAGFPQANVDGVKLDEVPAMGGPHTNHAALLTWVAKA
ncbi:hypothetical protein BT69DRAFT_1332507 [Atractiella rhizophila]|nr:hypothetical protein BT69DRAFT_1332507 [Atractiella rhizophila]